jgi:SAM-dependent methyltransferase
MWDEWASVHLRGSEIYPIEDFIRGKVPPASKLPDDIGSVEGKSILHLQCHFGMDSLMWARQGARVTGVDFSETAIQGARALNERSRLDAEFLQANIYDLPERLHGSYDIVLTYYGVLTWLPDLDRWAKIVAFYLKPGGFLYVADMHPFLDMVEGGSPDYPDAFLGYSYFSDGVPQRREDPEGGTYADPLAQTTQRVNYQWNHRLGTIVNAVAGVGLQIEYLNEYPYTFCDLFDWPQGGVEGRMAQDAEGWWRLTRVGEFLPLMFSLKANKMA